MDAAAKLGRHLKLHHFHRWLLAIYPDTWNSRFARESGLRAAAEECGAEIRVLECGNNDVEACTEVIRFLDQNDYYPDVIIAGNNPILLGVMSALNRKSVDIPGDMALVAFDDFAWSDLVSPKITLVAEDSRFIGAKAAGIIVVAVDTPAKGADAVVTTDGVQAGELSCSYLAEQLGGKGNILIVDGTPIQTITDRIKGCKAALEKDYPDIKVVGQQSSKNDRATGLSVTTDMLTANKDVQGIFGMNDPSALGAALAVEQAGRTDEIIVTGIDGSPEGVDELKRAGSPFVGTSTQNPGEMVKQAVAYAQKVAKGDTPKKSTILIPSVMVTRENVNDYKGW